MGGHGVFLSNPGMRATKKPHAAAWGGAQKYYEFQRTKKSLLPE